MAGPFSDPNYSKRDALEDLLSHPGYQLLISRLKEEMEDTVLMVVGAVGLQEVGRYQGVHSALSYIFTLRETMIDEIESEGQSEEQKTAEQRAYDAFYGERKPS